MTGPWNLCVEYKWVLKPYLDFQDPQEIFLAMVDFMCQLEESWDTQRAGNVLAASVRIFLEEISLWISGWSKHHCYQHGQVLCSPLRAKQNKKLKENHVSPGTSVFYCPEKLVLRLQDSDEDLSTLASWPLARTRPQLSWVPSSMDTAGLFRLPKLLSQSFTVKSLRSILAPFLGVTSTNSVSSLPCNYVPHFSPLPL